MPCRLACCVSTRVSHSRQGGTCAPHAASATGTDGSIVHTNKAPDLAADPRACSRRDACRLSRQHQQRADPTARGPSRPSQRVTHPGGLLHVDGAGLAIHLVHLRSGRRRGAAPQQQRLRPVRRQQLLRCRDCLHAGTAATSAGRGHMQQPPALLSCLSSQTSGADRNKLRNCCTLPTLARLQTLQKSDAGGG
jgi:hypothetical protein